MESGIGVRGEEVSRLRLLYSLSLFEKVSREEEGVLGSSTTFESELSVSFPSFSCSGDGAEEGISTLESSFE